LEKTENFALSLRKEKLNSYLSCRRFKPSEEPLNIEITNIESNSPPDLNSYNIFKDLSLDEITIKYHILITTVDEKQYSNLREMKDCIMNIRKHTCRSCENEEDIQIIVNYQIHIFIFKVLEHYQAFNSLSEEIVEIIHEALWALQNLVHIGRTEVYREIHKRKFIIVLKNYLNYNIDKITDQVATCLGNIVVEGTSYRDLAIKQGLLYKITTIIQDIQKPNNLIRSCLYLLTNLLRGQQQPESSKVSCCISTVVARLWSNDSEIVRYCLTSLYLLTLYELDVLEMIVSSGCLPKIFEYLLIQKEEIQLSCLRIIGNLACANSKKIFEKLVEDNAFKTFTNLFQQQDSQKKEYIHEILWCLVNFSDSSIKVINNFMEHEKLHDSLLQLLNTRSDYKVYYIFKF
jgi:hypothetical protein